MIPIKSEKEIEIMRKGGKITAGVLKRVLDEVKPGVSTLKLNNLAEKLILEAGAKPSFKGFQNYPFATCININEGVVHGLPKADAVIKEGDLVTVDLGVYCRGYHTDHARTVEVEDQASSSKHQAFLNAGKLALERAIEQCRAGNYIGDISYAIQSTIEELGYSVVRALVGHGVGKKLHEEPQIPGFGRKGTGPKLLPGMTLAIEVIYAEGGDEVELGEDGWTIQTCDKKLAALFEHTVLVTSCDPIVLTAI